MTYVLDANVFIQAKNLHYGFDFCPAFWDWLDSQAASAAVMSIEKVGDELKAGADELATWASARPQLFMPPDSPVASSLRAASAWVTSAGYDPAAVSRSSKWPITTWWRTRWRTASPLSRTKYRPTRRSGSRSPTRASGSGSSA